MPTFKYSHPYHCPDGEEIDWPFDGPDAEEDVVRNLAEDWADEDAEDSEIQSIADDIKIERVR